MRKSIKAIVCTVSALVICAAPNVANYAGVMANTTITADAAQKRVATVVQTVKNGKKVTVAVYDSLAYSWNEETGEATLNGRYSYRTEIIVPPTININGKDYKITSIATNAFNNGTSITNVDLTSAINLVKIGGYAFAGTSIKSITIPESVTQISSYAFQKSKLNNINMSYEQLNSAVNKTTFKNCTTLKKINSVQIVNTRSNGEPYIAPYYKEYVLSEDGQSKFPFADEYLNAMLKYVVETETSKYDSEYDKVKNLHDWVCKKVDYAFKYDENGNKTPDLAWNNCCDLTIFMQDKAICEGYARGFQLLLEKAGITSYYIASGNHGWNLVKVNGKWYHIDACHDGSYDRGDKKKIEYDHFLISDRAIKEIGEEEGSQAGYINGHKEWKIMKPSDRFTYTVPSSVPTCPDSWPE